MTIHRGHLFHLAGRPTVGDSQGALEYMYSPSIGSANLAHFKLPAFDALYEELRANAAQGLGEIVPWGGMRVFSLRDLDGYKICFARSI